MNIQILSSGTSLYRCIDQFELHIRMKINYWFMGRVIVKIVP